ncbi:predicted protein [Postia placenta Mad-698-R]|nr:predicted protein [Postia placenta Mad-698-R]
MPRGVQRAPGDGRGVLRGRDGIQECREVEHIKVDVFGGRLRCWGGPETLDIIGGAQEDGRRPIPHLATFPSRFAWRWPCVKELRVYNAASQAQDFDLNAVVRNLAVCWITDLNFYDLIRAMPLIDPTKAHHIEFVSVKSAWTNLAMEWMASCLCKNALYGMLPGLDPSLARSLIFGVARNFRSDVKGCSHFYHTPADVLVPEESSSSREWILRGLLAMVHYTQDIVNAMELCALIAIDSITKATVSLTPAPHNADEALSEHSYYQIQGIVVNTWKSTQNEAGAHTRRTPSGSEMPHSRPRIAVVLQILSRLGHSGNFELRSANVAGLQISEVKERQRAWSPRFELQTADAWAGVEPQEYEWNLRYEPRNALVKEAARIDFSVTIHAIKPDVETPKIVVPASLSAMLCNNEDEPGTNPYNRTEDLALRLFGHSGSQARREALYTMVQPFPNEIWLDIFKSLFEDGEYDALERCRVVDASGGKLRRWGGPERVSVNGGHGEDGRRPIPHLATFASRFAGRWPRVDELSTDNAVWRTRDLDVDAVLRDLAVSSITELYLYDIIFPSISTLGRLASPWSVVRELTLDAVTFPSVTTFARLLSCAFVKHGFDLRSVPVHFGLPLQLADVDLTHAFCIYSDPDSVADLVEFFIATGLGKSLRRINASLSSFLRVASEIDAALSRLVEYSAQSLRHLSLHSSSLRQNWVHQNYSAAPYFNVSENTCLERLDLTVQFAHGNRSHLCAPVSEIMSQITSTHISRIQVKFISCHHTGARLDVDLGELMDGIPQLDDILSGPIFDGLTNVVVDVRTLDRSNVRDEHSAHELTLCLPRLDARGILGIWFNGILYAARIGMHWDDDTGGLRRRGIERVAAQDAVVTNEETNAEDDRRTQSPTTGAILHEVAAYVDA